MHSVKTSETADRHINLFLFKKRDIADTVFQDLPLFKHILFHVMKCTPHLIISFNRHFQNQWFICTLITWYWISQFLISFHNSEMNILVSVYIKVKIDYFQLPKIQIPLYFLSLEHHKWVD